MQVLLLGLFVALYLHDATTSVTLVAEDGSTRLVEAMPDDAWPLLSPAAVVFFVLGPKLILLLAYHTACLRTRKLLGSSRGERAHRRLGWFTDNLPYMLLLLFVSDLWLGALRHVRVGLSHVVLVDELIVLLPTLLTAAFAWLAYYPVDRRVRDATIMRLADEGRPVFSIQTRAQYFSMQLRHQFGLLLIPLLCIYAWAEALVLLGPDHRGVLDQTTAMVLTPVGVVVLFIFAPLIIRYVWHTTALPSGEVRERMLSLCRMHNVRIRELLLWRTGGGLINAAVAGMVAPVRYILLSDGLLDHVSPRAVEAVMAHEIAHVKLRHVVWMIVVLVATFGLIEQAGYFALDAYTAANPSVITLDGVTVDLSDPQMQMLVIAAPGFAITLWVFGWFSRRIERQADVFAARHLAKSSEDPSHDESGRVVFSEDSVYTMVHALGRVAELNHAPIERPSWRHGSIAWRQRHLRSLIGTPVDDTPVDRVLLRVKLAAMAGLALMAALYAAA